jgi:hypothetical protein
MSRFSQTEVTRAIAGAIKAGLHPSTFTVEISRAGSIRIIPVNPAANNDEADLDAELREWRSAQGG